MTRILRWKKSLYWWQLSSEARGDVLLRLWWLLQARVHQDWSWLVCSRPFLWANQQWLEWSCNYLSSNWLRSVDRSQSPSKDLFIGALVWAIIENHCKPCNKLLLRMSKCQSLLRRPQRRGRGLVSSIFKPTICKSSQCQNGPPEDCCGNGYSVLFKWLWVQTIGPDGEESHRFFCSRRLFVASVLKLFCRPPAALAAWALYYQDWLIRSLINKFGLEVIPKTPEL